MFGVGCDVTRRNCSPVGDVLCNASITVAERRPQSAGVGNPERSGGAPAQRAQRGGRGGQRARMLVCTRLLAAAPSLRCGLASADDGALVAVVDAGGRVGGRSGGRAVLFIVFQLKSRQQRCSRQHLAVTVERPVNGMNLAG